MAGVAYKRGEFVVFRRPSSAAHVTRKSGYVVLVALDSDPPYYTINVPHEGLFDVEAEDVLGLHEGEPCRCLGSGGSLLCPRHSYG